MAYRLDQQEIDEREQGCADTGGDQGVIGAEIVLHVECGLALIPHGIEV